ncbi:hypothetical protein ES703_38862 [subsurface metagenome]
MDNHFLLLKDLFALRLRGIDAKLLIFLLLIILYTWQIGKMISSGSHFIYFIIIIIPALIIYTIKRELFFFFILLLLTNTFSLFKPGFIRIPGIFDLRDLFLVILLMPLLFDTVINRNMKWFTSSPVSKVIFFYWAVILFIGIFTVLNYGVSSNLTLRIGRTYLYYALFFTVPYYIRTKNQFILIVKFTLIFFAIFIFLYLTQWLVGESFSLFMSPKVDLQIVGGHILTRTSVSMGPLGLAFWPLVAIVPFLKSKKSKLLVSFLIIGWMIMILATLQRAGYYLLIVGVFIIILFLPRIKKTTFFKSMFPLLFTLALFLTVISSFKFSSKLAWFTIIGERALSGFEAVREREGTWGYRMDQLKYNWSLVKQNPITGAGLIHPETGLFQGFSVPGVVTADNALATILGTTGLLGFLSLVVLSIVYLSRTWHTYKLLDNNIYKGIILGFFCTFLIAWGRILTTAVFITWNSIANIAIMMGMTEIIFQLHTKKSLIKNL